MENNIYFEGAQPSQTHELFTENYDSDEEEDIKNINQFIFTENEEGDRRKRRFTERKYQYARVKGMIKRIEDMEKDKALNFDGLDEFIKPFFISRAKEMHKHNYAEDDDDIQGRSE